MDTASQAPTAHAPLPLTIAVLIQAGHTAAPFAVEQLTRRRLELIGPSTGELALGRATAVLSLPGGDVIRIPGTVVQVESWDGASLYAEMNIDPLQSELGDQIEGLVADLLERSRLPMVVALDGGRLETSDLRPILHALGREVVFAQDLTDGLWLLDRFRDSYASILLDLSFVHSNGLALLPLLHDQYPDKRRILVGPRHEASASRLRDLGWSFQGVLTTPLTTSQVEGALGLFAPRSSQNPKRIMFVDDEPAVLSALQHRLRKYLANYETVWVTSGEVALAESRARPFEVVVADLRMPGMDGLALLRAVRDHAPRSKRVVLSGADTHATRGVADVVLHKPCSLELLRTEVLGPG